MARCTACGTETAGGKFCAECGAPLSLGCANCGAPLEAGDKFCRECGTPASATAPAAPQPRAPVSERRVCSVLFADLVGFTSLSESRDPEEVRELLSRYFDVARRLIGRYGGIVEKFIGDAVMAVWGTPTASEGDTERAVRAALDLVAAVETLGQEVGASGLSARAGVVTGEVAVNLGAVGEGMVAGDAVNTASRVQSVARPGSVFVDETTRRLCESAISFEDEGAFELKGKEGPERLSRATRILSGVGGRSRSDALEAPFQGRDAELRTLKDLFHTTVDRRTPRLVVVSGPAGVGKSRLAWEFEKYIDGLADTVLWHRGRCLSYGEGIAFWALSEIVRQRFGIAEEDPTEVAATKLQEGMVRFVADEDEREYIGTRLSRLLGVPYPSETRAVLSRDELYAGWRLFFERLAQVAPVVILVEDAQHADEGLLGFVDHLIDWTRELPIFVLVFARPGVAAIDSGFGVGRNRSTLSLDPLDDSSMSSLVQSLVPGMPAEACDAIAARAQGIALFAVETVRSLIDRGVVVRERDSYRLVGDIGDLRVPDSLHSLLAARLDALPSEVRSLVADASVLGSSFPKEALVAISQKDEEFVAAGLAELVKRDVLEIFADPLSPERGAYRFGQEMLRQVAYETLSKKDRKARHLAVASHLRRAFTNDGEEVADAIARHYLDALAQSPGDNDGEETRREAQSFLVRAAERAERSGGLARAAESYEEAGGIAPPTEAPQLYERAARALFERGDYGESIRLVEKAHASYDSLGDVRGAARARVVKAQSLIRSGRLGAAREELAAALEVLHDEPDDDTVEALATLAAAETFSGNPEEGAKVAEEAARLGQGLDSPSRLLARAFVLRGVAASFQDRLVDAAMYLREAARLTEASGDLAELGHAHLNLADIEARLEPRRAVDVARSATAHLRRQGRDEALAIAISNLATALLEIGEWDEAEAVVREGREVDNLRSGVLDVLAICVFALRGKRDEYLPLLEAVATERTSEERQVQATVKLADALVALDERRLDGALTSALAALEEREALGISGETTRWAWPLAARAARALGRRGSPEDLLAMLDAHPVGHLAPILKGSGRLTAALRDFDDAGDDDALTRVAAAVEEMRQVANPYELAHALIDEAECLLRAGATGAEAALTEAGAIGEKLGCPVLLERAAAAHAPTSVL